MSFIDNALAMTIAFDRSAWRRLWMDEIAELRVRVSREAKENLQALAKQQGVSLSSVVRSILEGAPEAPSRISTGISGDQTHLPRAIYLSGGEWKTIKETARKGGMTASEFVRKRCLEASAPVVVIDTQMLKEAQYESFKQGVNLNQIARRLNEMGNERFATEEGEVLEELAVAIAENRELVAMMRELLRGRKDNR